MSKEHRNIIRQKVLAKRDSLSSVEQVAKSISISSRVMALPEINVAQTVLIYMHFRSEVQTLEMIKQMFAANQTVTIPYTNPDKSQLIAVRITDLDQQVAPGYCGILEPLVEFVTNSSCDPAKIDAVIVPSETRPRLIKALETMCNKRETSLPKKHGNVPL